MTVFVTPEGQPFYAGTYFPPQPRHGLPSFGQLLEAVSATWTRDRVAGARAPPAASPRRCVEQRMPPTSGSARRAEVAAVSARAVDVLASSYDALRGGFGGAPKFPPSMVLE